MYHKSTLPNGLRVLTVPMPQCRSVTMAVYLGAGSRYEVAEQAGISHFIEHMLFKGTKRRPKAQIISETIEGVGGFMNAATDREVTTYWAKVAKDHLPIALDLLGDMLLESLYKPEEIERERHVITEEISSLNDSPQQRVDLLIDEVMWPGHSLGRDVGGTRETVGAITRDQMVAYIGRQYAPNNAVVALAGDLDHEAVVQDIAAHFGAWKRAKPLAWEPSRNGQKAPRVGLFSKKTEQAHLCLAYPGVSGRDPDRFTLDLLSVVLGEGMSSRLFVELRERRALAYDIHSYVSHFQDDGAMVVYAGVDPKNIEKAIGGIRGEIERLRQPIPDAEMHKAKEMTKGRLLLRTEDTRSMAGWVGGQELLNGEVRTIDDVVAIIEALTAEDLRRVAERVLNPDKVNLAVVGPYRSEARFQRVVGG
ncbi:MAG: insulinase family protein [Chloroflexi bacterium]|nr:insulinase family protein [Chloroflexota bacterium]